MQTIEVPPESPQSPPSPEILWDIVEESLDEAEFLWRRWESALDAHDRDLDGVSFWVEERLLGALEGVKAAGDAAIEPMLAPALAKDEPSLVAATAYVLASIRTPLAIEALSAALMGASPEKLAALRRGVELVETPEPLYAIAKKLSKPPLPLQAAFLQTAAFRRHNIAPSVLELAGSADPHIQRAAAFAARYAAPEVRDQCAEYGLRYEDVPARNAAIETGLLAGLSSAWNACLQFATKAGGEPLLVMTALLGRPTDQEAIFRALAAEPTQKSALWALGFAGSSLAAETCLECMVQGKHVQLAADSFCAITGLDLEKERLIAADTTPEKDEPVPFEEEDLEADLVPSPEAALPLPDVAGVKRWWTAQRAHFVRDPRYVGGRPVTLLLLQESLERGAMRRRHGFALELAIRSAGRYQVQTRAFTGEQRRHLAAFPTVMSGGAARSPLVHYFSPA
jgi:uncharacterized protein (TIGR02270 family)